MNSVLRRPRDRRPRCKLFRERLIRIRQRDAGVGGREVLGEVFTERRADRASAVPQPDLFRQKFPGNGVDVVQVDNRFGISVRGRQEVPAEDAMPADLIPDRLWLQNAVGDELLGGMYDGNLHLGRPGIGQVARLRQDNHPFVRRRAFQMQRPRLIPLGRPINQRTLFENVPLGEGGFAGRNLVDHAESAIAACFRAVTAAVIRADDQSEDAAKDAAAEADRAMDWLKQAVAAGFKNAAHMKQDTDLEALRTREDFKQLIAELEATTEQAK